MSFWLGVILPTQVVLLIDRMMVDQGETRFFWRRGNRRVGTKYLELNQRCFFLPCGSLNASNRIYDLLGSYFKSFSPWEFRKFQSDFQKGASSMWAAIKGPYAEICKKSGAGVAAVTCLIGGIGENSGPFLAEVNDVDDFLFNIHEAPGRSISAPQGAVIDSMVKDSVRDFLELAMRTDWKSQREIAKKKMGGLLKDVCLKNKFVSPPHDLLFIGEENTEIWGSSPTLGRYKLKILKER